MIKTLVNLFYSYWILGAVFGLYFVIRGAARLDAEAKTMSLGVRLLLLPGSIVLWPLLLRKLLLALPHPPISKDANSLPL